MDMAIHLILLVLASISALLAIRVKELNRAIASFAVFNVLFAILFYVIGAPYVAAFQLLVYGGALTVLFLAALHVMGREPE